MADTTLPKYTAKKCRTCGGEIIWLKNTTTGKPAPIDAAADPMGNCLVDASRGTYTVLHKDDRVFDEERRRLHTSHWQTCPDRQTWKEAGRERKAG